MAIFFIFTMPLILFMLSIAFDGSNLNSQRSRLSDSLNESALVVATKSSAVSNQIDDILLSKHYIDYYLTGYKALEEDIKVLVEKGVDNNTGREYVDYSVDGRVNVPPMITGKDKNNNGTGFSRDIKVVADANSGIVRRADAYDSTPTDFVFAFDFSPSMLYPIDIKYNPNDHNDGTRPYPEGVTKLDILKEAVLGFMSEIKDVNQKAELKGESKSTVGIVPFTVGVPIAFPRGNQVGGPVYGCSFAGKFKENFELYGANGNTIINFEHARKNMWFWYDKAGIYYKGNSTDDYTINDRKRMYDKLVSRAYSDDPGKDGRENRFYEAKRWLAHSQGFYEKTTGKGVVDSWKSPVPVELQNQHYNWVEGSYGHNKETRIVNWGTAKDIYYSKGRLADIGYWGDKSWEPNPLTYFIETESNFISGVGLMVSAERYMSPVNIETLDVDGTFNDNFIFDPKNVTEYVVEISPGHSPSPTDIATKDGEGVVLPFRNTCRFDYYSMSRANNPPGNNGSGIPHITARNQIWNGDTLPPHYLVNLTDDMENIGRQFNQMKPNYLYYPSTDSSLALLRSVPVLGQGKNPRKVIIMVTDGSDSVHGDSNSNDKGKGPLQTTELLHTPKQGMPVCDRIREGFKKYDGGKNGKPTEEFDIYMITLSSQFEIDEGETNVRFWETNCVGAGKAFQATDIDELKKALFKISQDSSLNFINRGD